MCSLQYDASDRNKPQRIKYNLMGTCIPDPPQKNLFFPLTERTEMINTPNTFGSQFKGDLCQVSPEPGSIPSPF